MPHTPPKDVTEFIAAVDHDTRREDALRLLDIFHEVTGETAKFWAPSIIGFGDYHYKYESGREGDSPNVAFSPRKARLVLYIMGYVGDDHPLMAKLGKYKTGKVCLYVNKLADIDMDILKQIIRLSYDATIEKYG